MRLFALTACLLASCTARPCGQPPTVASAGWTATGAVVRIVDGDTLVVRTGGIDEKVRVKGIDCPESRSNPKCKRDGDCATDVPLGKRATAMMQELAPVGVEVRLVGGAEQPERDRYGRLVAYVERGGQDVGLDLVRSGICQDYSHKFPHPRSATYLAQAPLDRVPTGR